MIGLSGEEVVVMKERVADACVDDVVSPFLGPRKPGT